MAETRPDLPTRLTRRNSKEEEMKTEQSDPDLRAARREKRKLSTISEEGEPKTKRIKLKSQRKKNYPTSSKEESDPIRQPAVIAVDQVVDEDIPNVVDLTCPWLRERKNVANFLSRTLKVTAKEFLTSENISLVTTINNGGKILLGRFFFASTDSDVVAMKEDFDRAGYICHHLHKELLLCKAFHKALPPFWEGEKVISVFSNVNVSSETVHQLQQVSKHTKLLTFSKDAFVVFKTNAELERSTKTLISYSAEIFFDLKVSRLHPPQSPPLGNIPATLKTRPDTFKILVLRPLFRDKNVKKMDPKLIEKLLKRMLGLSCTRVETQPESGGGGGSGGVETMGAGQNIFYVSFVSESEALSAYRSWRVVSVFGMTWSILPLHLAMLEEQKQPAKDEIQALPLRAETDREATTDPAGSEVEIEISKMENTNTPSLPEKATKAPRDNTISTPSEVTSESNSENHEFPKVQVEAFISKNKSLARDVENLLKKKEDAEILIQNLEEDLRNSNEKHQTCQDRLQEREKQIATLDLIVAKMEKNLEETKAAHDQNIQDNNSEFQKEKESLLTEIHRLKRENENLVSHDQFMAGIYNRTVASLEEEREKVKELENMKTTLMNESLKKIKLNLIDKTPKINVRDIESLMENPPNQDSNNTSNNENQCEKDEDETSENSLKKKNEDLEKIIQDNKDLMIRRDERICNLTKENNELKKKNSELKLNLELKEQENKELTKHRVQTCGKLIEECAEIRGEMRKINEDLKERNHQLRNQLSERDFEIEGLDKQLRRRNENIKALEEISGAEVTPTAVKEEIVRLKSEIQKSHKEMGQYFIEKETLKFESQTQQKTIAEQEEEIRRLSERMKRRVKENDKIREELTESFQRKEKKILADLNNLSSQLKTSKKENEKIRNEMTENFERKEKKILKDYNSINSQLTDSKKEIGKLEKIIKSVSGEYPAVLNENGELKKENKELKDEKQATRKEIKALERDYERISAYIQGLEDSKENLQVEKKQIEVEKEELKKKVNSLKLLVDDQKNKEKPIAQSVLVSKKNDSSNQENSRLTEENLKLLKTCNFLKKDLKQQIEKTESLEQSNLQQNEKVQTERDQLNQEKADIQKMLEVGSEENVKLKESLSELEKKMLKFSVLPDEVTELKARVQQLLEEKRCLVAQMKSHTCPPALPAPAQGNISSKAGPSEKSDGKENRGESVGGADIARQARLYPNMRSARAPDQPGHKLPLIVCKPSAQTRSKENQNHLAKLSLPAPETSQLIRAEPAPPQYHSSSSTTSVVSTTEPAMVEGGQRKKSPTLRVRPESEMKDLAPTAPTVPTVPTAEQFAEILRMEKSRRSDEELIKFRNKIIETMLKDHVDNVITDPHQRQLILKQIIKNIDAAYMMVCPIFYLQAQQAQIPSSQPQPASQQQWRQQNHHQHQLLPQLQQYPAVANNRPLHQHQQCPPPPPPQLQRQPHIPSQISPQSLQYQHRPAARMRSLPTQISMQNQYPCQSMPMTHYNYQTGQSQTMYSGFSPPTNNTDCVQENLPQTSSAPDLPALPSVSFPHEEVDALFNQNNYLQG